MNPPPKKEVEPIAPNSEAESQTKYTTYIEISIQVKNKINEEEAIPPPYEAGECSSSGSRPPGHPHSTPWSCERAKTKLITHVMQDSTLCPRQYLHAPLLCRGALCRVSHQPGKYGIKTKHNRFNSRQAVRSNPFMGKKPQVEVTQGAA